MLYNTAFHTSENLPPYNNPQTTIIFSLQLCLIEIKLELEIGRRPNIKCRRDSS